MVISTLLAKSARKMAVMACKQESDYMCLVGYTRPTLRGSGVTSTGMFST
jgi:hypothetical protein